jgi:hypothetical protein
MIKYSRRTDTNRDLAQLADHAESQLTGPTPRSEAVQGCPAHRQTSSPGARIIGQNGRRSAERAAICAASFARALSAYLHRHGDRKWGL